MKQKSDVAEVFWKFKVQNENQTDCKLKVRFDNETEYTLDKFQNYYEEVRIHHQLTNIYTL